MDNNCYDGLFPSLEDAIKYPNWLQEMGYFYDFEGAIRPASELNQHKKVLENYGAI